MEEEHDKKWTKDQNAQYKKWKKEWKAQGEYKVNEILGWRIEGVEGGNQSLKIHKKKMDRNIISLQTIAGSLE